MIDLQHFKNGIERLLENQDKTILELNKKLIKSDTLVDELNM